MHQALPAIVLAALRRFGGPALFRGLRPSPTLGAPFWPSGLTLRSSRPAYGGRLTLAVRGHAMEILLIACGHGAVTYFYAITHDDDRKIMIFTWVNVAVACFLGNPIFSAIDIAAVFAGSTFGSVHRESFSGMRRNRKRSEPSVEGSSYHYAESDSSKLSSTGSASDARTIPTHPENGERIRKVSMTDRSWLADRAKDCRDNAYECTRKVRAQLIHASVEPSHIFESNDMWAVGYIFGFADGWMQHIKISNNDPERMTFLTILYRSLLTGNNHLSAEYLLTKSLENQGHSTFLKGMIRGGNDAFAFNRKEEVSWGLSDHFSKLIVKCGNCGQKLRVPRGKFIDVTCPKCKTTDRLTT